MIFVKLVGESVERRFVCGKCLPDFIGTRGAAGTGDSRPRFMSSSSILEECGTAVRSAVQRRLADDDRFVGRGDIWFVTSRLYVVREEHVDRVIRALSRSPHGLPADALADAVAAEEGSRTDLPIWSLSLAIRMRDDVHERFVESARGDSDSIVWTLAPPPSNIQKTVSEHDIAEGRLGLTKGMWQLLANLGHPTTVHFTTYGQYGVPALFDAERQCLQSDELREWLQDAGIRAGDAVHIRPPDPGETRPRLFSLLEARQPAEPGRSPETGRQRLGMREAIVAVLLSSGQFLHITQILNGVTKELGGQEQKGSTLAATLSRNTHVFERLGPGRGVWGLREWTGGSSSRSVDPQALLMAIGEDDLVVRVLTEAGRPLDTRSVARAIAEHFMVRTDDVLGIMPVDWSDARIVRATDGRWLLAKWPVEWGFELERVNSQLAEISGKRLRLQALLGQRAKLECERQSGLRIRANIVNRAKEIAEELRGQEQNISKTRSEEHSLDQAASSHPKRASRMRLLATRLAIGSGVLALPALAYSSMLVVGAWPSSASRNRLLVASGLWLATACVLLPALWVYAVARRERRAQMRSKRLARAGTDLAAKIESLRCRLDSLRREEESLQERLQTIEEELSESRAHVDALKSELNGPEEGALREQKGILEDLVALSAEGPTSAC